MNASISFLTPLGASLVLGAVVPLVAILWMRRRARRAREAVALPEVTRPRLAPPLAALGVTALLLGLAAAQPILEWQAKRAARTDAQAYVVVDVSRSMLAAPGPTAATRLARAKAAARAVRGELGDVPVGIASLTDRMLPHLFPSVDEAVFESTLDRSIDVDRPPPRGAFSTTATQLDAIGAARTYRFFPPTAERRALIVLTDGESRPPAAARLRALLRERTPPIDVVWVHVWGADERVFTDGAPEAQYRSDPAAREALEQLAEETDGTVYDESRAQAAGRKAHALLGDGPTVAEGTRRDRLPLAPYLSLVAFVPLAYLLGRRER